MFDYKNDKFLSEPVSTDIECCHENFVMKCLADHERDMHHVLYRHG